MRHKLPDTSLLSADAGPTASLENAPECATTPGQFVTSSLLRATPDAIGGRQPCSESVVSPIRPDYRRAAFISTAEAADLTGYSPKTIRNALWSGRIQRGGVGRYCIDQSSVIRAFSNKGKK
jgi:hypothetical protein